MTDDQLFATGKEVKNKKWGEQVWLTCKVCHTCALALEQTKNRKCFLNRKSEESNRNQLKMN